MQRLERDRLAGPRHHRGEDAVADDGIGQHETGGVEKAGKAAIKLVELGRGNRQAAVTQQLRIRFEPDGHDVFRLGVAAQAGADEAVVVARERLPGGPCGTIGPRSKSSLSPSRRGLSLVSTNTASVVARDGYCRAAAKRGWPGSRAAARR